MGTYPSFTELSCAVKRAMHVELTAQTMTRKVPCMVITALAAIL